MTIRQLKFIAGVAATAIVVLGAYPAQARVIVVDGTRFSQALDDVPKHLVLEYRVAISAEDFAGATLKKIRESVSDKAFNRLLPKIDALNQLYKNVRPGDRYSLTYIPGAGTRLTYKGTVLGTVEGADFARALFAIWIGDTPIDKGFRDRLLGRS